MSSVQDHIVAYDPENVKNAQGYEQLLRAVGQALEKGHLQSFELTPLGNGFHILGSAAALDEASVAQPTASRVRSLLNKLPNHRNGDEKMPLVTESAKAPVEIRITFQDIQQLEIDGRARRVDGHLMANAASLSQVLRCLGGYLNQKRARLLRLTRDGETVSLEYETSLGSQIKESFSATGLYDMWVRMYMQRAGRLNRQIGATESRVKS